MTQKIHSSTLALLATAALVLASACGTGGATIQGPGGNVGHGQASFTPGNRVHIMPTFDPSALTNAASSTQLKYYGGHVISNVKVVAVWWGSGVNATVKSQMPAFYSAFTKSPMFDWLSEYNTNITATGGGQGTNQVIGHGSFLKAVQITPSVTSSTVSDSQIQSELNAQISAGKLPAPGRRHHLHDPLPQGDHHHPGQLLQVLRAVLRLPRDLHPLRPERLLRRHALHRGGHRLRHRLRRRGEHDRQRDLGVQPRAHRGHHRRRGGPRHLLRPAARLVRPRPQHR